MDVISCKNVSKQYLLYPSPRSYLKEIMFFRKKKYHNVYKALNDISFTVGQSETVGIIGSNGAGKSTLLKILAGTTIPSSGEISVKGKISALLELGAGFHYDFSGRRNILLNGTILGFSGKEIREKFDSIVSFAELEDFIDLPIKTYSSGMVVRLGFSIAIHTDPDILLIDEVLAVGDISFQKKCIRKLNDLRRAGKTILLVSHSLGDMGGFCDRIILLSGGNIIYDGNTEVVIKKYLEYVNKAEEKSESLFKNTDLLGLEESRYERRTKEIVIESVSILNIQGNPVKSVNTGEGLSIFIEYFASQPVNNPLFRVGIFRSDGFFVSGTNTYRHGIDLGVVNGKGRIGVVFDRINLLQGTYYITVEICKNEFSSSSSGITYDCHNMKYELRVNSKREDGGGFLFTPSRWLISNESKAYSDVSINRDSQ